MADLAGRSDIESRLSREMGRLSASQRDRLVELLGNPPDPSNVPESFWEEVERERREKLAALLLLVFLLSARQHGAEVEADDATGGPSGGGFSGPVAAGVRYAEQRAREVAGQFVQNSREALARIAQGWRERLALAGGTLTPVNVDSVSGGGRGASGIGVSGDGAGEGSATSRKGSSTPSAEARPALPGPAEAKEAADAIFAPSRDDNLAVSETTDAATAGGEHAVSTTQGLTEQDLWKTERDGKVCTICGPLDNQPRSVWSRFFPKGPRAHNRCRCWLSYKGERKAVAA